MELNSLLPVSERPEYTEKYEGFYHITKINGNVEQTVINYIIRDHNREKFEQKKNLFKKIVDFMNEKYGNIIVMEYKDQYYNMKEKIEPVMYVVDIAKNAMKEVSVTPSIIPIRGGTDGAMLSFKGLPCPNIFTGGHNFHGKFEYVPVFAMNKAVETIIKIADLTKEISLA
jgi:tripeptide aminopeptidase